MNPEHNTDIVERLRSTPYSDPQIDGLLNEAIVEIERLRAKCAVVLVLYQRTRDELKFRDELDEALRGVPGESHKRI